MQQHGVGEGGGEGGGVALDVGGERGVGESEVLCDGGEVVAGAVGEDALNAAAPASPPRVCDRPNTAEKLMMWSGLFASARTMPSSIIGPINSRVAKATMLWLK